MQRAEDDRDLAPVDLEHRRVALDELGDLGRQEAPQPAVERLDLVVVGLHAQQRAHAGEQLGLVERLRDEVVGARLERAPLLLLARRGDHHHRQERGRRIGAQAAADLVAVESRHHHVEQHEVDVARRQPRQRLLARGRRGDRVAARLEHRPQQPHVLRQIVDDEDHGRSSASTCAGQRAHVDRLLHVAVEPRGEDPRRGRRSSRTRSPRAPGSTRSPRPRAAPPAPRTPSSPAG